MWWMLAGAAAKVGLSVLGGEAGRAAAKANSRVSAANAEASNSTRKYKNAATAATNNLARWQQSLNNQRILKAGGDQLEANTQNYLRSTDARSYDDINRALGDAEQLGAQAAAAGNTGAIGGVADMVDTSTRIRAGIVERLAKDQTAFANHDNAKRAGMIFSQTVQSLDSSLILDSFDFQMDVGQESTAPSRWASAFPALASSAISFLGSMGASGGSAPAATTSPYSLTTASNAKFGFKGPPDTGLPSSDNGWSLTGGQTKGLFSTTESYRGSNSVNPYSLWGSNG